MKNAEVPNTTFSLTDFYLTAFLISSGMELVRTDRASANRMSFALRDTSRREQLIQDFYAHKAKVDPLKYKDVIVNLKSLIHGLRNAG